MKILLAAILLSGCASAPVGPPLGSITVAINNPSRDGVFLYADGASRGHVRSGGKRVFYVPEGAHLALRYEVTREFTPVQTGNTSVRCWTLEVSNVRFLNEILTQPCE